MFGDVLHCLVLSVMSWYSSNDYTHTHTHTHTYTHTALLSSSQRPTNLSVDYTDSSHSQTPRVEGLANKHPRQPNTPSSHNQETRIRDDNRDTTDRERSMSNDPAVSCEEERRLEDHIDDRQVAISDLPPGPSPLHLAAKSVLYIKVSEISIRTCISEIA